MSPSSEMHLMQPKPLKNKPLVEAILEIRWALEDKSPGMKTDRHYRILTGRLFDRLQKEYPEYEPLPTAQVPDELVGHVVQHRFRTGPDQWPVVQLGPGIQTLNSTEEYSWDDFRERSLGTTQLLFEAHPRPEELRIENLVLRYIDAVDFNHKIEDVNEFLKDKLKVKTELPESLFLNQAIQKKPKRLRWESTFECENPQGRINMQFATGERKGIPAVVWETTFESSGTEIPKMPKGFAEWVDGAHRIVEDWFFKLIDGELARRFSGE